MWSLVKGLWGASHLHGGAKCLAGRGWGPGACRVSGQVEPQTGEDSANSSPFSSHRDHGGLGIWEPG